MTFLLTALLAASPVEEAKSHLSKGQIDDVLFALEGKKLSAAEQPEAHKVLVQAAKAALDKKDAVMALHLAAMALKLEAKSTSALETAARAAFAQQEFEEAEKHADAWVALEPKSGPARLLRAELAAEAGEWERVLEHLNAAKLDSGPAKALRAKAQSEKSEKAAAMSQLASITKAMEEAARRPVPPSARPQVRSSSEVVLYGTSWCGYCKKARDWLNKKGVSFVERDVESDPDAAQELARKAQAAGVVPRGVPVIDVKGKLVLGFDPRQIEAAL